MNNNKLSKLTQFKAFICKKCNSVSITLYTDNSIKFDEDTEFINCPVCEKDTELKVLEKMDLYKIFKEFIKEIEN